MGDSPTELRLGRKSSIRRRQRETSVIPEQRPDEIPKADDNALRFLRVLGVDDFKKIEFCDRLTTFSNDGKEIGNFCVSISTSSNGLGRGLLVKASSVGNIDGLLCGTKITAVISQNMLETIEHRQNDFLFLKEDCIKRDTEIVKQGNGFLISRCSTRAQETRRTSRLVDQRHAVGLISEGADLILQRLLALKGISDAVSLIALDTNANIGTAKYERLTGEMKDGCVGISRTVFPWQDTPVTWHSQLTNRGQLVQRHQIGSAFTMKSSPNEIRTNINGAACCLDRENKGQNPTLSCSNGKTKYVENSEIYLKKHPELRAITTDFLQLLFVQKPGNVPLFAANYFASLASESESSESTAVGTT